jgi:hypothetical protein
MKPVRTYLSLTRARNSSRLFLFIILLAQVFYLSVGNIKVPLPSKLLEATAQSLLPSELDVIINRASLVGFSNVELESFVLKYQDKMVLEMEGFSLKLQPHWPTDNPFKLIEMGKLSNARIFPVKESLENFQISNLSLGYLGDDDSLFLKTTLDIKPINTDLHLEIRDINKFLKSEKKSQDQPEKNLTDIIDAMQSFKDEVVDRLKSVPPMKFKLKSSLGYRDGSILLAQVEESANQDYAMNRFFSEFSWSTESEKNELINFKLEAKADELLLTRKSTSFSIKNPLIAGTGTYIPGEPSSLSLSTFLTYKNSTASGNISGQIPPCDLHFNLTKDEIDLLLFTDQPGARIACHFFKRKDLYSGEGFIHLTPHEFDIRAVFPQGDFRIIDGEKLHIRMFKNKTPVSPNSSVQFKIIADNFTALEVPNGNFRFTGEISRDFSLFINSAYGKLGKSEVTGSYSQKWNPANYRFLIEGKCYPPDINNWLGTWWSPLWEDFSFTENIPVGDFSIEGIWGGSIGNSVTLGRIKTKDFHFRSIPVDQSLIKIEVDSESTRLVGKKIQHHHGLLHGSLVFPRSFTETDHSLSYSFRGDVPVREASNALGPKVKNVLDDLNASSLYCETKGQIAKVPLLSPIDENSTWYNISFISEEPFAFAGIHLDHAEGVISYSGGQLKGSIDQFGVAGGQGVLRFSETSPQTEQISISLDLKNAEREKLIQILSNSSQWQKSSATSDISISNESVSLNQTTKKTDGKIDLSLQAEGPISNLKYFEGTGNFVLHDVDIGSIHILGGIRSKLGAFNLPLPSDALNFNRLEMPFTLEHERIIFDQANLLGPLSKVKSTGEINWITNEVDLLADFQLAGNLPIPILKQIVNLADPLSKLSKIKIKGDLDNPDWSIHFGKNILNP